MRDNFFYANGNENIGLKLEADVAQAKTFGLKFKETFSPEFESRVDEVRGRVQRLNSKEPVVLGVPNSIVYYFLAASAFYVGYRLLFGE
jgi:hypothetical protein